MSPTLVPRLPGVTFEVAPGAPPEVLPRMDIAGLVGFAASGPVDVPVAVDSAVRFREVFGPDLQIARDPITGQPHRGFLGQAVEAFFRNGGLRCWVIRVAERPVAGRFQIPGLVSVTGGRGRWSLGTAWARSGGSWSDSLAVGGVLEPTSLPTPPPVAGEPPALDVAGRRLRLATSGDLVSGDLLRITAPGREGLLFIVVATVEGERGLRVVGWEPASAWWLVPASAVPEAAAAPTAAYRLTADGPVATAVQVRPTADVSARPGFTGPSYDVLVAGPGAAVSGDVLRVDYGAASMLLPVGEPLSLAAGAAPDGLAGMRAGPGWFLTGGRVGTPPGWWQQVPLPPLVVERLGLDLLAWREERLEARLDGLGLTGRHSRSWQGLPTDDALFGFLANLPGTGGPRQPSGVPVRALFPSDLWGEVFSPRFPLATVPLDAAGDEPTLWLPVGVPDVPDPSRARTGLGDTTAASRMRRDGLQDFSAALFLDQSLQHLTAREVIQVANDRAFLSRPPAQLRGLHGLIPIEEVTLAAVPDAAQPGWERITAERPQALRAPVLKLELLGPDTVALSWTHVPGATEYLLEQADEPAFEQPLARQRGPETIALLGGWQDCPALRAFRARAAGDGLAGPWSNTCEAVLPAGDFAACARPVEAPVLELAGDFPHGHLSWTQVAAGAYHVEASASPAFETVDETETLTATALAVALPEESPRYYRVRLVLDAVAGPWSNTAVWMPPPQVVTIVKGLPDGPDEDLLAVHRSLLRACAARGDVLAVLALPRGYQEARAAEHLARLAPAIAPQDRPVAGQAPGVPPLDADEETALSFAAVYHPWVSFGVDGDEGPEVRTLPPDGAACGRIASRAMIRGPWVAPANEILLGALALDPVLPRDAQARLLAAGLNLVRADPQGFVIAGSDTLSLDLSLRPIGARRLLILLRRIVLRDGDTYVFQPHDRAFRTMVVRKLDTLLADLYRRGAFAGRTPAQAYRVVGDDSNNPPFSVDQGRFVLDLLVAPSQPMKFIRVRLVQAGPAAVTVEEVASG